MQIFQWLVGQDELYRFRTRGIRAEFLFKKIVDHSLKSLLNLLQYCLPPIHPRPQKAKSQPLDHQGSPEFLNSRAEFLKAQHTEIVGTCKSKEKKRGEGTTENNLIFQGNE